MDNLEIFKKWCELSNGEYYIDHHNLFHQCSIKNESTKITIPGPSSSSFHHPLTVETNKIKITSRNHPDISKTENTLELTTKNNIIRIDKKMNIEIIEKR